MRSGKQIFDDELSGEPLEQDVVIDAIDIAQVEAYNQCIDDVFSLFGAEYVTSMKKLLNLKREWKQE